VAGGEVGGFVEGSCWRNVHARIWDFATSAGDEKEGEFKRLCKDDS
jgi:hypothetical protein